MYPAGCHSLASSDKARSDGASLSGLDNERLRSTPLRSDIAFAVIIDPNGFASAKRRECVTDQSIPIHPPELLAGVQLRCPTFEGFLHSSLDGRLARCGFLRHAAKLERSAPKDPMNCREPLTLGIAAIDRQAATTLGSVI